MTANLKTYAASRKNTCQVGLQKKNVFSVGKTEGKEVLGQKKTSKKQKLWATGLNPGDKNAKGYHVYPILGGDNSLKGV